MRWRPSELRGESGQQSSPTSLEPGGQNLCQYARRQVIPAAELVTEADKKPIESKPIPAASWCSRDNPVLPGLSATSRHHAVEDSHPDQQAQEVSFSLSIEVGF